MARPSSNLHRGARHLTEDWRARQGSGPLVFDMRWIPFANDRDTPVDDLTRAWETDQDVSVGTVTFPQIDPDSTQAKLETLLASEIGANPGHWDETPDGSPALPSTRFTAARQLAYRVSQETRQALPEALYTSFFERGEIEPALAGELVRRYQHKRTAGHWVPDVGEMLAV